MAEKITVISTPAQEYRVKALGMQPEVLDTLDPNAKCRCIANCLPDDAVVCGLYFDAACSFYKVLIASASYERTFFGGAVEALRPMLMERDETITAPCPIVQDLAAFIARAKASIGAETKLEDVIILPRYYMEGIQS